MSQLHVNNRCEVDWNWHFMLYSVNNQNTTTSWHLFNELTNENNISSSQSAVLTIITVWSFLIISGGKLKHIKLTYCFLFTTSSVA